ncbi:MAG: site-2 protease family protein [Candidatus Omnitrophica bacterium]|nr:site-2 protease family protein [Candidatus Omnitrophota bacterium]
MVFLIFVLILSVLIVVHEAGHFFTAKKMGVRVEQFALGFGPKLFSRVWEGTEYCLCAIPLGGYVKMAGDDRTQCKGVSDEYFSKSIGHRSWIILMGPIVNYIFAYLCFVIVFMIGYVDMEATNKAVPAKVEQVVVESAAEKAGVKQGDQIMAIDGTSIGSWGEMQEKVSHSAGKELQFSLMRDGEIKTLLVTPQLRTTKDIFGREKQVGQIGVQQGKIDSPDKLVIRKYSFVASLGQAAGELGKITGKTYSSLWEIITGQRSAKEGMTGLIGIFFIIKFAVAIGLSFLLHVVGIISASLAIFNLLPIIPLDGGHLFLLGLEKMRGRALSLKTDELMAKVGFAFIIVLAAFVFYVDFERIGLIDRVVHFLKG